MCFKKKLGFSLWDTFYNIIYTDSFCSKSEGFVSGIYVCFVSGIYVLLQIIMNNLYDISDLVYLNHISEKEDRVLLTRLMF